MDIAKILSEGGLLSQISQNQFATGGLILGIGAGILASLRRLPKIIWDKTIRIISFEITVYKANELFTYLEEYFSQKPPTKFTRNYIAFYKEKDDLTNPLYLTLGRGSHIFFYEKTLIKCTRIIKEDTKGVEAENSENFHLRIFTFDKNKILSFFKKIVSLTQPNYEHIKIYSNSMWKNDWGLIKRSKIRNYKHLILKDGLFDFLVNDIQKFFNSEKWFSSVGVPYKRGYLFYGPPGNGKTSTIIALASKFNVPVYIINVIPENTTSILSLMSELPKGAFLIFEDVDTMIKSRDDDDGDRNIIASGPATIANSGKKNIGAILNALDGLASPEGHIVFMTTNHIDSLDPALIRPGRIDEKIEFQNPDSFQGAGMFKKFFPQADDMTAKRFGELLKNGPISAAILQELLLVNRTEESAIEALNKLVNASTVDKKTTSG